MEPFRIITTREELASLRIDSIVCPPKNPAQAMRKAWAGVIPNEGLSDIYVSFESTSEWGIDQAWQILTMHCPLDADEAWVLWDSAATAPEPAKPNSWRTAVPGRSPKMKSHTTLGHAKAAVSSRVSETRGTSVEMTIWEDNPVTGDFDLLHVIPVGTIKSQLPW
jgi:hypothetical protein